MEDNDIITAETDEQTHSESAEAYLRAAESDLSGHGEIEEAQTTLALVHAVLAVADELRTLNFQGLKTR